MNALRRAVTRNSARTVEDDPDAALRGRTYAIPFIQVWRGALGLVAQPRWSLVAADEDVGLILAEATTRFLQRVDDVSIRVSLDANGQTRVDMESSSRGRKADLGANRRRIRRFMLALDGAVQARPTQILDPATLPRAPG